MSVAPDETATGDQSRGGATEAAVCPPEPPEAGDDFDDGAIDADPADVRLERANT
jgi:hypothetical protein